jgi:hypothetical protein
MAIEPQNLIQIQSDLQNPALVTNETLLKYANGASPQVPSFLALLEMNRRKQIDEGSKSFEASSQASVKDQIASQLTQPTQTASGMTGIPFNTNPAADPRGIDPTANPFGKNMAQKPAGINPTAAPMQPNTAPIQPITGAAGGLMSLPVDHFNQKNYAGGGIVAFAKGDIVEEEKRLSSFPEERAAGKQRMSDAEIERALQANQTEEAPVSAKGSYEAIRAGLPSLRAQEKKTDEELFAEKKAIDKMAGVAEDPYADVKARQAKREARQEKGYEQAGMDRLIAQLSAFAQADPSRGFGYAGAASADASEKLEREQNAMRDKEESAQIEFQRAVAKEEDARRRGDASGVVAAKAAQEKAALDFQKAETDVGSLAAQIFNTQTSAETQRAANAANARYQDKMVAYHNRMADIAEATKPTAEDKKITKAEQATNADPQYREDAKRIGPNGGLEPGSPEFNAVLQRLYRIRDFHYKALKVEPPPMPPLPDVIELAKKPGWWARNAPEFLGGAPSTAVTSGSPPPPDVQKVLDKYK